MYVVTYLEFNALSVRSESSGKILSKFITSGSLSISCLNIKVLGFFLRDYKGLAT